jgi:paraquat-inducible protein B
MSEAPARTASRPNAEVERSRWPGWIWAVPVAALAIVIWLLFRALAHGGVNITIRFDNAADMKADDTAVKYRGYEVGKVRKVSLSGDGQHFDVKVNIHDVARKFLTSGTRFWLEGGGTPSLTNLSSLEAVVSGPTIIMDPGGGKPTRHFVALPYKPAIIGAHGPMLSYTMSFDGAVGQLPLGAPVTLRGFTVGVVKQIDFHYDPVAGAIETPVTVELDPDRFHIESVPRPVGDQTEPMLNDVLERLIKEGMRARLAQTPPLVGSYEVSLDFVSGAPDANLITTGLVPQIPTVAGGGVESIVDRVNKVPIDEIAQRVLQITASIEGVVSSPQIKDSLNHLDHTLMDLDRTIQQTGPQITQLVSSLRQTANELDTASASANRLLGGSTASQDRNVKATLYELTQAARSVRSLADYLDRHPEAIVKGKTE